MTSAATTSPSIAHTHLSIKAACIGFVASTTAMTILIMLLGKSI